MLCAALPPLQCACGRAATEQMLRNDGRRERAAFPPIALEPLREPQVPLGAFGRQESLVGCVAKQRVPKAARRETMLWVCVDNPLEREAGQAVMGDRA